STRARGPTPTPARCGWSTVQGTHTRCPTTPNTSRQSQGRIRLQTSACDGPSIGAPDAGARPSTELVIGAAFTTDSATSVTLGTERSTLADFLFTSNLSCDRFSPWGLSKAIASTAWRFQIIDLV